jgi:hypothetical protein
MKTMTVAACTAAGKTRSRRRFGVLIVTAAFLFSATSTPAFSADNGSVSASVTPAAGAACITLDKTSINFGSLPLSQSGAVSTNSPGPNANVLVSNCGDADSKLFGRATNATNQAQATVTWTLDNSTSEPCAIGANKFQLRVSDATGSTGGYSKMLSQTDQLLGPANYLLGPGRSTSIAHEVRMPCTGSGGVSQAMSWQYIYTATL